MPKIPERKKQAILILIREGAGTKDKWELAREAGVDEQTIQRFAREIKVNIIPDTKTPKKEFIAAHHLTMTAGEIAKILNVTASTVREYAAEMGITCKAAKAPRKEVIPKREMVPDGFFNYRARQNWLI